MDAHIRFDGVVAIVTGAGRGLGRAHALMLASRGCRVLVNDLGGGPSGGDVVDGGALRVGLNEDIQRLPPSTAPADEVVSEIRQAGGVAMANYDSVADGQRIVDAAVEKWGSVQILVCNAGIVRTKYFADYTQNDWDKLMEVHLQGTFSVVRAVWPQMCEQNYGRIVFTASSAGLFGQRLQSGYAAAKMAMVGLARVLALEGKRYNINTNVIAPAAATRITDPAELVVQRGKGKGTPADPLASQTGAPTNKEQVQMSPQLVAPLVAFLCHDSCDASGSIYHAGGGWYGRVELIQAAGMMLDEETIANPSLASPEMIRRGFAEVEALDGEATINGPGNQALGHMLYKRQHERSKTLRSSL